MAPSGHKSWSCMSVSKHTYLNMCKRMIIASLEIKLDDESFSLSQAHALSTGSPKRQS